MYTNPMLKSSKNYNVTLKKIYYLHSEITENPPKTVKIYRKYPEGEKSYSYNSNWQTPDFSISTMDPENSGNK